LDQLGRRVDGDDRAAHAGERLGKDAGATADIEDTQAGKRFGVFRVAAETDGDFLLDPGEPGRVQPVQWPHRAALVPPFGGERRKAGDLGGVDGGRGFGGVAQRARFLLTRVAAQDRLRGVEVKRGGRLAWWPGRAFSSGSGGGWPPLPSAGQAGMKARLPAFLDTTLGRWHVWS